MQMYRLSLKPTAGWGIQQARNSTKSAFCLVPLSCAAFCLGGEATPNRHHVQSAPPTAGGADRPVRGEGALPERGANPLRRSPPLCHIHPCLHRRQTWPIHPTASSHNVKKNTIKTKRQILGRRNVLHFLEGC